MGTLISLIIVILAIIGGFSVVAAFTPNKSDNEFMQSILTAINILGANFFKAANKLKDALDN
jgi:hypothetical protein|tara:strand:+ start:1106 stop:1291 length:186 start_codon:yes stop_codon:yes gene_type:complete